MTRRRRALTAIRTGSAAIVIGLRCMIATAEAADTPAMPLCGDTAVLDRVGLVYRALESNTARVKITRFGEIRETALGPPQRSASQYANDRVYIAKTRYCEASVMLDSGGSDTVYWTIHHFKSNGADEFRPDACSAKHDSWGDACAQWRPSKRR